jgi:tRNA(Ile)-lysidine synthase
MANKEQSSMGKPPPSPKMEEKVHQTIKAHDLLIPGDRIVVAVSGGPDSVALLACLVALSARWNFELSIGHVNHGLRGTESDDDVAFVEQMGDHFGVPVSIRKVSLKKQDAKRTKQSFQAYAREVRYQALEDILQDRGATKIATGHTADDQAETVLMWMLRGSGTGGLSGIPPKRGARIVRPILDVPRSEIVAYLHERQLAYRMDSSNSQPVYLRNRIRRDLMPQLKGYAPGIVNVLSRQAEMIREDHVYLEQIAAEAFQKMRVTQDEREIHLDRTALLALPLALRRRVVRHGFHQMNENTQGPRFDIIQGLLDCLECGQSGWRMHINTVDVGQEYDRLIFSKRETSAPNELSHFLPREIGVDLPGEVIWPLTGQHLKVSVKDVTWIARRQSPLEMHLDADTFTHDLRIRSWRPGDVFYPKGMGGRQKKLQDFFSDIKLPRSQRKKVPLLVSREGILWVGGLREDERFQVSSGTTSVVIATMTSS